MEGISRTVVVTGAAGFAGSRLCRALIKRGDKVRALVRKSSNLKQLKGLDVEFIYCDLANEDVPIQAFQDVDVVFHIAAAYRKEQVPDEYFYQVNLGGTERVLKACREAGVKRIVHCSTVGVLGNIQEPPATETSPYNPGDVYQRSKMEGECLAISYHQKHNLPVVIVRPGAIYGPGDTRFLKLFRWAKRGIFPLIGGGDNSYHLVYIDDLIQGFLLAGEKVGIEGEVFIIAGNEPVKVKKLIYQIAEVLGKRLFTFDIPLKLVYPLAEFVQQMGCRFGFEPPIYPRRLDFFIKPRIFDISKAKGRLGYTPKTDLMNGLKRTAEWYRQEGLL